MKTSTSTMFMPIAAVLLTAALAGAGPGEKFVPLSGSLQAEELGIFQGSPPVSILVTGSGAGIASHLGRFTITWSYTVIIAAGTGSGTLVFTAANGDQLFATAVGQSQLTDTPGVFSIREEFTITGGSGRFLNAQGHILSERLTDQNTHLTSGSFHGAITSPGLAK